MAKFTCVVEFEGDERSVVSKLNNIPEVISVNNVMEDDEEDDASDDDDDDDDE